jgi:hypothetical protein
MEGRDQDIGPEYELTVWVVLRHYWTPNGIVEPSRSRNKVLVWLNARVGCNGGANYYILCEIVGGSGMKWDAGLIRRFAVQEKSRTHVPRTIHPQH